MIECIAPQTKAQFLQYYQLRWQVLRAPWQQEQGSEKDELEDQSIHRMLVNENQQALGVGRLHFTEQNHAQIRYMAVCDKSQGLGLGQKLVEALEYEAIKRGAITISLNAREQATNFYQRLGYQLHEFSHLLYDEIKHFVMCKELQLIEKNENNITKKLQETWYQTIPLSKAMNIAITYYDGTQLLIHCDPRFNKNLHNTMFAGSIYTLATLTGWGWVYLQLLKDDCQGDIVLADANIKYKAPIKGVVSARTSIELVEGSQNKTQSNKKLRFTVTVEVCSGDKVAALFTGHYVVLPKSLYHEI